MNALILAAGRGARIAELTGGLPKSFLEIGGKKIIEHQIDCLENANVGEVVVITGYRSTYVEDTLKDRTLTFERNPFFERSNVLGSVWFGRKYLAEGFYFMHADTLFDCSIFDDLVGHSGDLVLCVEMKQDHVDEEMKVRIEGGRITDISKTMPNDVAHGEFTGLMKVSEAIAPRVVELIEELVEVEGRLDDYFESVVQRLIDEGFVADIVDIRDRLSIEIDSPEDYERALERYADLFDLDHG
jgi:choline kinase